AVYVRGGDRFHQVVASPDGTRVIATTRDSRLHGYLFHTPRGEFDQVWETDSHVYHETPGGFLGADRFVTIDRQLVVVRDAATGGVKATHPYPSSHLRCLAPSPDCKRFAAMGWNKLYVWDTETWGKPTRVETGPLVSFAFHPARPLFAAIQREQRLVKFF